MAELVCGTADRDAWLEARRSGITATDLPVILGLVTWDSPFALFHRKQGRLPEVEQTDRMRLGSWLEGQVADYWAAGNGMVDPGGLFRSSDRPWQLATPDRIMYGYRYPLECKTSATRDGWGHGIGGQHECDTLTCEENSRVPAHVRAQVLWQMDTLGVSTGHVAVVFIPSGEFRSYTIRHNCERTPDGANWVAGPENCRACCDVLFMVTEARKFWHRILHDSPPPVDGLQVTTDALRYLNTGAVKGQRVQVPTPLALRYSDACEAVKNGTEAKREAENEIRQLMGDATLAEHDGYPLARREVFKRAGYEVAPCKIDRLVRVKPKEGKSDE